MKNHPKIFQSISCKISALFIFVSLLIFFIFFTHLNIDEEIEKELEKVEPNHKSLTWNNIKKDFELLVNKYKYLFKHEKNIDENSPIWMMWYQGIENAPPLVKSCIQSVIKNKLKHPLYIISKYNLEKYVKLPFYIIEKFNKGIISITHLSDIIRFALLFKYGGYWIDSTYFITTPLRKVNTNFYTLKLNYCFTNSIHFIKCIWSGNFFAVPKNSFIATYGYFAFLHYWKKYNSLIHYFLIDYIIYIAYKNVQEFKDVIIKLPYVPCKISSLSRKLNSNFNKSDISCYFNKINRKRSHYPFNDKKITNYGYIIKNYKLDLNNNVIYK